MTFKIKQHRTRQPNGKMVGHEKMFVSRLARSEKEKETLGNTTQFSCGRESDISFTWFILDNVKKENSLLLKKINQIDVFRFQFFFSVFAL